MSNRVKYLESCTDEEFFDKAANLVAHIERMYRFYDTVSVPKALKKIDVLRVGIHYSKYRSVALRRQNGNRKHQRYSKLINRLDKCFVDFMTRFSEND